MKLLFLDVDGVLNHDKLDWTNAPFVLDPACVERLKRIVTVTRTAVVLSSTWRLSDGGIAILQAALAPVVFLGATPVHGGMMHRALRCREIREFMEERPAERWAVLDDDWDADLNDGSFFQTSFEAGGLTEEITARVIAHLGAA